MSGILKQKWHGLSRTKIYKIWVQMRNRCQDPSHRDFPSYGGRGITICERWRDDVEAFVADMGERPHGKSLDRIDNDGNYEPANCRWATPSEQANNQRRSVKVKYRGELHPVSALARRLGIPRNRIVTHCVHGGRPVEEVLARTNWKPGRYTPWDKGANQ